LRVAGYPRIETVKPEAPAPESFEFTATFEIFPEVTLGDLSAASVERPAVVVGDAEVDRTIEVLRKQRTEYEPAERAAAAGDAVVIDYAGEIDGVPFDGGSAAGQAIVLGEGRLLPDFEKNVIGLAKGQSRTFDLVFPEDYHGKEVAGRTASFTVTVQDVREAKVPSLDGDFARALGVADGDLTKMRDDIRANLEREVKRRVEKNVKDQVLKVLLDTSTLDVPKALIDMEIERLMAGTAENLKARGMGNQAGTMPREVFEPEARRRVTIGLVLAEVVKAENIRAEAEQIKAVIEDYAQSYERPDEVVRWYYQSAERVREIESVVIENNVVENLLARVQVTDKPMAFDDLMGNAT